MKLNGGPGIGVWGGGEYCNVLGVAKPLPLTQVEGLQRGVYFALPRVQTTQLSFKGPSEVRSVKC